MSDKVVCLVGLGNPGSEYEQTRHNVGVWLVKQLAEQQHANLKFDKKFSAEIGSITLNGYKCFLVIPTTYMNHSGQTVKAISSFYKIKPEQFYVVHDELDLPTGTVRLKQDGGHGGHNGLRDIINKLGTRKFNRVRLGISHPGHKDDVTDYVLKRPSISDRQAIEQAIGKTIDNIANIISGQIEKAMLDLHTETK